MKTLSIDIETYSSVDLAKCGVYKYTEATDFDILLFGYSTDGGPVQVVDLARGETIPPDIYHDQCNRTRSYHGRCDQHGGIVLHYETI